MLLHMFKRIKVIKTFWPYENGYGVAVKSLFSRQVSLLCDGMSKREAQMYANTLKDELQHDRKEWRRKYLLKASLPLAVIAPGLFVLSGCQPSSHSGATEKAPDESKILHLDDGGRIKISEHTLANGLECLVVSGHKRAGITCNWEKYNKEQDGEH
jgi:hypothetical protein